MLYRIITYILVWRSLAKREFTAQEILQGVK